MHVPDTRRIGFNQLRRSFTLYHSLILSAMTSKETIIFYAVLKYFQMTIKILQICYLTHTHTTKLVDHVENCSWFGRSY